MIIFISDLHISDGTAGPDNISPGAYIMAFRHLSDIVDIIEPETVTIVFLGDVFDLIRSASWQGLEILRKEEGQPTPEPIEGDRVDPDEKPWGKNPTERVPSKILDKVLSDHAFQVLSAPPERFGFPVGTKRVYVPGNHDMVINKYPELRKKVADALGIDPSVADEPFKHYFYDPSHRTFARHGHEFDPFNFGSEVKLEKGKWTEIEDREYWKTPIGDVFAAELASAIPKAVEEEFRKRNLDYTDELDGRLKKFFDLRPLTAIPLYLTYEFRGHDPVELKAISAGLHTCVRRVRRLPFTKKWVWKRIRKGELRAYGVLVGFLIGTRISLSWAQQLVPLVTRLTGLKRKGDNLTSYAIADFGRVNSGGTQKAREPGKGDCADFVLYGHTHDPDQRLISIGEDGKSQTNYYLNTGMWRPAIHKGEESGYTSIKHITYTIVYEPKEVASASGGSHTDSKFNVWTGTLKD